MRDLPFRYSLDYNDFVTVVMGDFERWLDWELRHGGATNPITLEKSFRAMEIALEAQALAERS